MLCGHYTYTGCGGTSLKEKEIWLIGGKINDELYLVEIYHDYDTDNKILYKKIIHIEKLSKVYWGWFHSYDAMEKCYNYRKQQGVENH